MSFPRYPAYKPSGVEWLGEVPEHWTLAPLKILLDIQNGCDYKAVEAEDGWPVIGSGGPFAYASQYHYDGESVLLGRKGTIDRPLYIKGRFWVVDTMYWSKIRDGAHGRFTFYMCQCIPFQYYSTSTALPSMTKSLLGGHVIAVPCEEEQSAIATFLDRETAKIDALIAEQQRLIELLQEKRQAVISHAVTKGLNQDAPMKDSGVEWLGDVPGHWELVQLKRLSRPGSSITYGIVQAGPHIEDGMPYIRTSDMAGEMLSIETCQRTSHEIDKSYARSKVNTGDLVVAIRATVGKVLEVPEELDGANLTQGTAKFSPGNQVLTDFIKLSFESRYVQAQIDASSKGATFAEITLDSLRRLVFAVPSIYEQAEIASRVNELVSDFQGLIADSQRSAELLQERRSALISAAVTGQIDVRGLVPEVDQPMGLQPATTAGNI